MKKSPNQLPKTEPPAKVAPRGKAIHRTDAELDAMTSADAMTALAGDAASDFHENAPEKFKTILDSPKH